MRNAADSFFAALAIATVNGSLIDFSTSAIFGMPPSTVAAPAARVRPAAARAPAISTRRRISCVMVSLLAGSARQQHRRQRMDAG